MVTRGLTRQYSCDDIYRGKPQHSKENLSYFHFVKKKNPRGQTWHWMHTFLRDETQQTNWRSSENALEIHPFYTIKHIRYITIFWKYGVLTVHYNALQQHQTATHQHTELSTFFSNHCGPCLYLVIKVTDFSLCRIRTVMFAVCHSPSNYKLLSN